MRKILEGNSEDGKVLEHILLALRLVGDWETCHPRLCWHSHLQVFPISTPTTLSPEMGPAIVLYINL